MKRLLPLLLFFAASCSSDWWLGPHLKRLLSDEPRVQAAAITPITNLSSGAPTQLGGAVSGSLYAQADRIDVLCTASGAVTLHLIEWSISGARWSTQGATGCALDSASGPANATCRFIAKRAPTYWHVYKTGAGSVSNCLIEAVYAGAGLVLEAQTSGGSSSSSETGLENIREIALWLDATAAPQQDTSAVLAALDLSAKGHRFTGGSGITYLAAGGPNNKAAWSFDGSSYFEGVGLNNLVLPGGSSAASVFAIVSLSSFVGTPELLQVGTDHATFLNSFQFAVWTDGGLYCAAYGGEGNERYSAASTISTSTWTLIEWIVSPGAFSSSNPVFKKNGVAVSSTRGAGASVPNIQPANARVGGNLQGPASQLLPAGSRLAEIIVMNSVDATKIASVESYLLAKYAL